MSLGAHAGGDDGPADARQRPPRRRLLAGLLSFVLVIAGILLISFGVIVAIVAVEQAVGEAGSALAVIVPGLVVILGLGISLGGARFITRVRPWVVRRLCGCEVPRIPAPIAAMASGPYYGD